MMSLGAGKNRRLRTVALDHQHVSIGQHVEGPRGAQGRSPKHGPAIPAQPAGRFIASPSDGFCDPQSAASDTAAARGQHGNWRRSALSDRRHDRHSRRGPRPVDGGQAEKTRRGSFAERTLLRVCITIILQTDGDLSGALATRAVNTRKRRRQAREKRQAGRYHRGVTVAAMNEGVLSARARPRARSQPCAAKPACRFVCRLQGRSRTRKWRGPP